MIQEIEPKKLRNEFKKLTPTAKDFVLIYKDNQVLLLNHNLEITVPTFGELVTNYPDIYDYSNYLFAIDEYHFYIVDDLEIIETNTEKFYDLQTMRSLETMWLAFAVITGHHIYDFYRDNKFCGRCGSVMIRSKKERALCCDDCKNTVYPKISPAVIVAITDGDRILLTRYSKGLYKRYGLVAGFVEVGETLEQCVAREVMEEVGLKVKNIRYYKNQPWAFSDSLLVGFFAELDGSDKVTLEEEELAEAVWFSKEDIPENPIKISLTIEMIDVFRKVGVPSKE